MTGEQVFDSVKGSLSLMGAFFVEVARELGEDRAIELYARQGSFMGSKLARIIQKHAGQPDAQELIAGELKNLYDSFGVKTEFEAQNGTLAVTSHRCPFFEGFRESGLTVQTIHRMCQAFSDREAAKLRELLPGSDVTLTEFRTVADGCCKEEYKLTV